MIVRLTMVTTFIALFALSFSVLVDTTRQRTFAAQVFSGGQDCLADGLLCAPGGGSAAN
jgi:hypothetical protein